MRNSRGGGWDAAGVSTYEMPAADALELLASFDAHQVHAAVSGGWAIDALLGEQHRPHTDLDVWVEAASTEALIVALVESGVDRYEPRDVDRHDVALLCDRFGLDRPPQFR